MKDYWKCVLVNCAQLCKTGTWLSKQAVILDQKDVLGHPNPSCWRSSPPHLRPRQRLAWWCTIWSWSNFKPIIEQNREHLIAGDSAFAISDVLIKPYSNEVRIQAVLISRSSYPFLQFGFPFFLLFLFVFFSF